MSLHWTEEQLASYLRRGQPAPVSEAAFMQAVIRLARQHGWMAYHTWSSKRSPEGFPDLVLAKAGQPLYVCECKRDDGHLTLAQAAWLEALQGATGVVSEVWRPQDMDRVIAQLRG